MATSLDVLVRHPRSAPHPKQLGKAPSKYTERNSASPCHTDRHQSQEAKAKAQTTRARRATSWAANHTRDPTRSAAKNHWATHVLASPSPPDIGAKPLANPSGRNPRKPSLSFRIPLWPHRNRLWVRVHVIEHPSATLVAIRLKALLVRKSTETWRENRFVRKFARTSNRNPRRAEFATCANAFAHKRFLALRQKTAAPLSHETTFAPK